MQTVMIHACCLTVFSTVHQVLSQKGNCGTSCPCSASTSAMKFIGFIALLRSQAVASGEVEKDIPTSSWSPRWAQLDPFTSTASPSIQRISSLESKRTDSASAGCT